ncbi:MAG: hypothetical protein IKZ28_02100, partial [Clostridia bacterium]|nr:hypothetical protein [Clostridia bacterium]
MKKKLLKIFATATLCCSLFLLGGCSLKEFGKTVLEKGKAFYKEIILGQRETPPENCPKQHFTVETKVKYEGQADVGKQEVCEDSVCVIRAQDTEDYEFWFWEKDGEPISDEAEYIFKPTADETYYAVFKPKNNDYVLINVVYEKDWYANEFYDGISVLGEGYQKKGEELSLLSDGELPVSWFTVRKNWLSSKGERTRGPSLTLSPVRSVTVVVEYEQVCEIVLKETPNCYIFIEEGDVLMNTDEKLSVQMHVEEGYVADYWTVTAYPTPWAEQDDFTVYTWDEGVNWGKDWHYQISIASTYCKIEISLTVTNENLAKPYKVEVIKEKGYSLSCSMSIPEYYIAGKDMYGGYYMGVYPSENAYIQDVRVMVGRTAINAFHGEYTGGLFHIPDAGQAFDG